MNWQQGANWVRWTRTLILSGGLCLTLECCTAWAQVGKSELDDPFAKPAEKPAAKSEQPNPPAAAPKKPSAEMEDPFTPSKPKSEEPAPGKPPSNRGSGFEGLTPDLRVPDRKTPEKTPEKTPDSTAGRSPSDSSVNRARELIADGKNVDALRVLAEAIRIDPKDADAYQWRGVAERNLKHYDAAIAAFGQSIKYYAANPDAYLYRGIVWYYKGEIAIALADFDDAQSIALDDPRPQFWRGLCESQSGDYRSATASYSKCLLMVENPVILTGGDSTAATMRARMSDLALMAYVNRGLAYMKLGDRAKGKADFERALRINPTDGQLWFKRGVALQEAGELSAALNSYDSAIRLDNKNAAAYYNRGLTHAQLGHAGLAAQDWATARRLNPNIK